MATDIDIVGIQSGLVLPVVAQAPPPPPNAVDFSDSLIQILTNNQTVIKDKTIPIGKKVTIVQTSGRLANTDTGNQDIQVRYIFDPGGANEKTFEIGRDIYSASMNETFSATPTQSKIMRIQMKNGTTSSLWLSARYIGYQEDL